jgi:hypothetical protein
VGSLQIGRDSGTGAVQYEPVKRLCVKFWEIVAEKLGKAGWTWGCVSAVDSNGRTIWIADAHRDDGKRFVVGREKKSQRTRFESDRRESDKRNLFPFQFNSRSLIGKR